MFLRHIGNLLLYSGLAVESVMSVLFTTTHAEDGLTRELVATTLCNVSIDLEARVLMVDRGVVDVLANLSGATSEIIQVGCCILVSNQPDGMSMLLLT